MVPILSHVKPKKVFSLVRSEVAPSEDSRSPGAARSPAGAVSGGDGKMQIFEAALADVRRELQTCHLEDGQEGFFNQSFDEILLRNICYYTCELVKVTEWVLHGLISWDPDCYRCVWVPQETSVIYNFFVDADYANYAIERHSKVTRRICGHRWKREEMTSSLTD